MIDYNKYSDQELAGLLQAGDAAAFKTIYDKYWSKLFVIASKRLNDTYEAEEVVQDIFLNLWKKRESFQLKTGFENYLAGAVKFEVYKHRASRVKQETLERELTGQYTGKENQDWNLYDLAALQDQLSLTINTLPSKCKLIFTMSRNTDMTNKQIATEMGLSEKAVEKHISNALRVLKAKFGNYIIFVLILKDFF